MSDSENEVFFYLDELHEKKTLDMERAPEDVRILFKVPPARSVAIVQKWARTFGQRFPEEAKLAKKTNSRTRWSDKKKPVKKNHITKEEYQKTTAKSVEESLALAFKDK